MHKTHDLGVASAMMYCSSYRNAKTLQVDHFGGPKKLSMKLLLTHFIPNSQAWNGLIASQYGSHESTASAACTLQSTMVIQKATPTCNDSSKTFLHMYMHVYTGTLSTWRNNLPQTESCHDLHTHISFQICMHLFSLLNTKERMYFEEWL